MSNFRKQVINNSIINADCLNVIKYIRDKSVDLIIIDPPYNIKKAEWDKLPNYVEWMGRVFIQLQRILKNTGSMYFFHNDFLQIVELQNWMNKNSKFIFKQLIIWNKRFDKCKYKGFLDGFIETNQLRNYQKMVEYILFYTFQDETGLTKIKSDANLFISIKQYLKNEKQKSRLTLTDLNILLVNKKQSDCIAKRYFGDSQWELPTKKMYSKLQTTGFWQRSYEDLRQEYEDLRYTFNNQKTHHSVWNYEIVSKCGHITPKPVKLIENIIKHSSNINDLVFDCFAGSGTTGVACKNLGRNFILIEQNKDYYKLCVNNVNKSKQNDNNNFF